jgi:hypothetical protein
MVLKDRTDKSKVWHVTWTEQDTSEEVTGTILPEDGGVWYVRHTVPTTSTNYTSNNLPRTRNQRLPVEFEAPDDGRCVVWNMLSFIYIYIYIYIWNNNILIHCCILSDFTLWILLWCTDQRISNLKVCSKYNSYRKFSPNLRLLNIKPLNYFSLQYQWRTAVF